MKTIFAAALLASACANALASDFYVVLPVKGKLTSLELIHVGLNSYTLPEAVVGDSYSSFDFSSLLQVTGDPAFAGGNVAWSIASGALPTGFQLNATTGVLTGTPVAGGTSNFVVRATYKTKTGETAYQLKSAAITVGLASATLPSVQLNVAYNYDFTSKLSVTDTSTVPGQAAWSVVAGGLPQGVSLNASTGVISGAPSVAGTANFTLKAAYKSKSAQQSYSLLVTDLVDFSALMNGYPNNVATFTNHGAWSTSLGTQYAWSIATAASTANAGDFEVRRPVSVASTVTARVKYLVDNNLVKVVVNGTQVFSGLAGSFSGTGNYTPTFDLKPGINVIALTFNNGSGPAGFIADVRNASTDAIIATTTGWLMP